jgi:hypothetical protein
LWKQWIAFCDFVVFFLQQTQNPMSDDGHIHSEDEDLGDIHVRRIDDICDVINAEEVTIYSLQFGAADLILFIFLDDISKWPNWSGFDQGTGASSSNQQLQALWSGWT